MADVPLLRAPKQQGLGGVGGKEGDLVPASWGTSGFYYLPV